MSPTPEQAQAEQSTYLATAEEVKAIFAKLKTKPANKVSERVVGTYNPSSAVGVLGNSLRGYTARY